ncbi:MAG: twin-arginine translocation signal domain-containing protein [Geminicoccaceae bacterium]
MEREPNAKPAGRRDFLKLASVGAVAGTVAAATGASERQAEAAEPEAPGKGYRETAHVKRFYELARF